jgi:hypothetical protein
VTDLDPTKRHTIRIAWSGRAAPGAKRTATRVNMDYLRVLPGVTAGLHEDDSSAISWNTSWSLQSNSNYSGGTARQSSNTQAYADLTFWGSGVEWVARRGPNQGRARVFINGEDKGIVDLYASPQQWQQTVFSQTGLPVGNHTIRIVPTGTSTTVRPTPS